MEYVDLPPRSCHWCTMGEKHMINVTDGRMHGAFCLSGFREASRLLNVETVWGRLFAVHHDRECGAQVSQAPPCEWDCDCERRASLHRNFITTILNILHYDHLQVFTLFLLSSRKWSHALMFRKHYFSHALRVWTPTFDCLSTDFWPPAVVTLCHSADWMSGMLTSSMDAVVAGHKYCTATTPRCRLV